MDVTLVLIINGIVEISFFSGRPLNLTVQKIRFLGVKSDIKVAFVIRGVTVKYLSAAGAVLILGILIFTISGKSNNIKERDRNKNENALGAANQPHKDYTGDIEKLRRLSVGDKDSEKYSKRIIGIIVFFQRNYESSPKFLCCCCFKKGLLCCFLRNCKFMFF